MKNYVSEATSTPMPFVIFWDEWYNKHIISQEHYEGKESQPIPT